MAALIRLIIFMLGMGLALPSLAAIEVHDFDDPALQARYNALLDELRCPKCQNESIGSSNSPIARDMRARTATWLEQGRSDEDIRNAMVARFGDYVLYDPRLDSRTWLLWSLPGALVIVGVTIIALVVRQRRKRHAEGLSALERQRLATLLDTHQEAARMPQDERREKSP
ncbi:cytochrome c-type biogenesis protein [Phytohalomonas tamaricis]|uniref:cytochrome c-type biogenesis protein n=1 Tax=Phytohalomonas tamaricis TaxID=2081032 RepID=UPI0021D46E6E|nr:cytochrome c-type biogenesis protein [Phytohalomonas tamaricis]